jgi:hypothetical protein
MKKYYKYALFIILVACVALLSFCNINTHLKTKSLKTSYTALNSEMVKYKNKYGQEVAKVKVIETARSKDFLTMESQDAAIKKLQKLVKEKKPETAIIIETVTKVDTFTIIDTNGYFEFSDEWIELLGQTIKDSLTFNLIVKNEFNLIEKKGYLEITNLNPYTSTEALKVYKDIPRRKRIVVGAGLGAGIGYDVLTNKPTVNGGVYIGIYYKLFEF